MAQKDFIKGLERKGVAVETIGIVKDHFTNQTDLAKASVKELQGIGLSKEAAEELLAKLGKRERAGKARPRPRPPRRGGRTGRRPSPRRRSSSRSPTRARGIPRSRSSCSGGARRSSCSCPRGSY